MKEKYCYCNGKIIPVAKAGLKLNDMGILRGYGVFDFLRTYNNEPFLLNEHLSRFKRSAKLLNIKIPVSQAKLPIIINKLLLKNGFRESEIRLVLTGGPTSDGISYSKPSFFILADVAQNLSSIVYEKGIKLISCEYQREVPQAKTLNYITAIRAQPRKNKQGAFEILYVFQGSVLECTTSNFFIFKNNTLITPKDNILIGTTRNLVIKLAQNKFRIQERDLKVKELKSATEAFITASNKEIVPVIKINTTTIGNGNVGENTKYVTKLFHEHIKGF
ncbi:aminotransferase class IV [Patescibacteria group bacterium AH-259-L05]|nr:aminotransferase class IV [Patescibacteria group bacterium AH-259-L05]